MTTYGIVGLGLIGGSFAKALSSYDDEVLAWNRSKDTLALAKKDSVDECLTKKNVGRCNLIILTTYPKHCIEWLSEYAPYISSDCIVIDVAGTKRVICKACFELAHANNFNFIGCHPMAGTEMSGYKYAKATMFAGAPMVVVFDESKSDIINEELLVRLKNFLQPCGFGSWTVTTAEHHDEIIAYTSQLAHVISNAYANNPLALQHAGFSAGSWKDLTRVAHMNVDMWTELFLENREALIKTINTTINNLETCRDALLNNDEKALSEYLSIGDKIKRKCNEEEQSGRA